MWKLAQFRWLFVVVCAAVAVGCSSGSGRPQGAVTSPTASVASQLVRSFDGGSAAAPAPNPVVIPCPPASAPTPAPTDPPPSDPGGPSYGYALSRLLRNAVRPTDDAAPCQTNLWTVGVVGSSGS